MSRVHDTIRPVRSTCTALCLGLLACSHTTTFETGRNPTDGGLDAQMEEDAAIIDAGLGRSGAGQAICDRESGRLCVCSNGEDDDEDGLADGFDSECTGPFDDDEGTFRVNDVDEGNPNCSDCFYDGDHQQRNDGCWISTECARDGTFGNAGNCRTCDAQPTCKANCEAITPNGCDCFGCCQVTFEDRTERIRLVASCDMKKIADPVACPRCRLNETCFNPCETCELCPGRTLADLPRGCMNAVVCGNGSQPCMASSDCPFSHYCGQGCCQLVLF